MAFAAALDAGIYPLILQIAGGARRHVVPMNVSGPWGCDVLSRKVQPRLMMPEGRPGKISWSSSSGIPGVRGYDRCRAGDGSGANQRCAVFGRSVYSTVWMASGH